MIYNYIFFIRVYKFGKGGNSKHETYYPLFVLAKECLQGWNNSP